MTYKLGKCLLGFHLHRNNMTQKELAEKVNKTEQTISRYVTNQSGMSYLTALNIARAVGCEMEDLYQIIEVKK